MTDDQHGEGAPASGGRWDPLPQGDYDDGATAFVKLPEGGIDALLAADSPLAAPGHGYVPPQITVAPAPPAATDPAATGTWAVPAAPAEGAQWPDPNAVPQDTGPDDWFTYHPGVTQQWHFEDAQAAQTPPVAGHDVTGQWSIPVADGDLPDESGEFTTSSLIQQWGGTPPATLPGGAPAPWATEAAGQPWGQQQPAARPAEQPAGGAQGGEPAGGPYAAEQPASPTHAAEQQHTGGGAHAAEAPTGAARVDEQRAGTPYAAEQRAGTAYAAEQPAGPDPSSGHPHARPRVHPADPSPAHASAQPAAHTPEQPAPEASPTAQPYPDSTAAPGAGTPAGPGSRAAAGQRTEAAHGQGPQAPTGQGPQAPTGQGPQAPTGQGPQAPTGQGAQPSAGHGAEPPAEPAAETSQPVHGTGEAAEDTRGAATAAEGSAEPPAQHAPAKDARSESRAAEEPVNASDSATTDVNSGTPHENSAPPNDTSPHDEHPLASYVLRVNGVDRPVSDAWIGESLLYVLRERLGLAGAKDGCSQGECGACNVQVDGRLVASCLVPAVTAAGSEVRTVEGLAVDGQPSDVQRALARCGAVQCGFCVPGMAMTVHDLLEGNPAPTELETRQALCGNLCRCSGYRGVVEAVQEVVAEREAQAAADVPETDADEPRIPHQAGPGAGGIHPSAFESLGPHDPYGQDGGQA
ncbi:2Fe-2S iron-sulfur cluster-binding protein [Streptomyces sp. NPDC005202]|uniref:2Fe-2S iron-sulfur cluster-binding protein n=1 Tax=Streptomyces sp. NPDC005202 TaxID=3157021 RepID=UPI0033A8DACF